MQRYTIQARNEADVAAMYNSIRGAVYADRGAVFFTNNDGSAHQYLYLDLPTGILPTRYLPDRTYTTVATPPLIASLTNIVEPRSAHPPQIIPSGDNKRFD